MPVTPSTSTMTVGASAGGVPALGQSRTRAPGVRATDASRAMSPSPGYRPAERVFVASPDATPPPSSATGARSTRARVDVGAAYVDDVRRPLGGARAQSEVAESAGDAAGGGVGEAPQDAASSEATRPRPAEDRAAVQQDAAAQARQAEVARLRGQERDVRRHQVFKAAVGGAYVSAASYQFDIGPDGHRYIVGGESPLDLSPVENNPRATIQKMQRVRAAATLGIRPTRADRNATFVSVRTEGSARSQIARMMELRDAGTRRAGAVVDTSA